MSGTAILRHECSTPPGAVASTTSFMSTPKKSTIATSLTQNAAAVSR